MPIVFVHGVGVRDRDTFDRDNATRRTMLAQYVLRPLVQKKGAHFADVGYVAPFWGPHGVRFHWGEASIPDVALPHFRSLEEEPSQADIALAALLAEQAGSERSLEGAAEAPLKQAAVVDLPRVVETVLAPLVLDEVALDPEADPAVAGEQEALLLIAAHDVAHDPVVRQAVAAAPDDDAVLDVLEAALLARYGRLLRDHDLLEPEEPGERSLLGDLGSRVPAVLRGRIGGLVGRVRGAARRTVASYALDRAREALHHTIARFFGDAFFYLVTRDRDDAESIARQVLDAIRSAPRHHPDEPLIVIAHSMGGNIVYDLLTHHAPDLEVDALVTVGTQVGLFEEMKLFRASDASVGAPERVTGLKPRVRTWLNVYSLTDPFAYRAAPIFADAEDHALTIEANPLVAHSDYFKRPAFYEAVRAHLERAL